MASKFIRLFASGKHGKCSKFKLTPDRNYCIAPDVNILKELRTIQDARLPLAPYRVTDCVFVGQSFSEATFNASLYTVDEKMTFVDSQSIPEDEIHRYYSYGTYFNDIFKDGIDQVHKYLEGHPTSPLTQPPLAALQTFLAERKYHERCLGVLFDDDTNETETAIVLAIHLLSRLIFPAYHSYVVSSDYQDKPCHCPCYGGKECHKPVFYGNTGYGTSALWYGKADILLFPNIHCVTGQGYCSVHLPKKGRPYSELDVEEEPDKHQEAVKDQTFDLEEENCVFQSFLQAITFSFYQKKFQNDNNLSPIATLIPTISICKEGFDIYMYDTKYDVLLKNYSKPIPLWTEKNTEKEFNITSVIYLWLIINHLAFIPALPKYAIDKMEGTSSLMNYLDEERLQTIHNTICMKKSFKNLKQEHRKHFSGDFVELLDFSYPKSKRNDQETYIG